MADFLNYNSLSKDPVAMEEELNKVQMKLREEQLARHKLEGEMERIRRHNKHLQYNLKRLKIQLGTGPLTSPRNSNNNNKNQQKSSSNNNNKNNNKDSDADGNTDENDLLTTPENIRHLMKQNEDLRMQAEIDRKMKEFLDNQVVSMETQIKQLIARNGDLTVQAEVDKKMKEFLFNQWEAAKK